MGILPTGFIHAHNFEELMTFLSANALPMTFIILFLPRTILNFLGMMGLFASEFMKLQDFTPEDQYFIKLLLLPF